MQYTAIEVADDTGLRALTGNLTDLRVAFYVDAAYPAGALVISYEWVADLIVTDAAAVDTVRPTAIAESAAGRWRRADIGIAPQVAADFRATAGAARIRNKPLATRVTTAANGQATWTFSTPFAAGVVPIISADVQGAAGTVYVCTILGAPTNTSVTVMVSSAPNTSVLGLIVLGAPVAASGAVVHLTATYPTE